MHRAGNAEPPPASPGVAAGGDRLASALRELAGLLLDTDSFQSLMQQLADSARSLVPNVLTAGITVSNSGRIITVASADALGRLLDERQYDLDEGPCLQSMRTGETVDVRDVSRETRWGSYPAQVRAHGVEAIHSSPLTARDETIGVLNLYSAHAHAFDTQPVRNAAEQLGTLITLAITATLRNYGDVTLTDQLQQALVTRSVIDQAIGILVATQHCTPEAAFAILRGASQARNVRVHRIAQDLVERAVQGSIDPAS